MGNEKKKLLNINAVLACLRTRRKLFVSEADFQLELAWILKEMYPNAKVRLEYCPEFDPQMHIDILVIMDGKWIPIELKYKTKGCTKSVDGELYNLKNHGAKDVNCYLYLKDIERIETVKNAVPNFAEGYTVFITNDLTYIRKPQKANCVYAEFSLAEGVYKSGYLNWSEDTGEGTKKGHETPVRLDGEYLMQWLDYSYVDNTPSGRFKMLVNVIQ